MALSALQSSRAERATLNDSRYRRVAAPRPGSSYNTRILSAIRVDEEPAFPRKVFFGLGGLTLGRDRRCHCRPVRANAASESHP